MTYADIISYFERLATAHRDIRTSYCGDYDRIFDLIVKPDDHTTPALWIESPEMTPVGTDDSSREQWDIALVVVHKGSHQNSQITRYETEQAYRTARSLLYRIVRDTEEGNIRFSIINKTISAIDPYSSDYLVGWRIRLTIDVVNRTPCYIADEWNESIGVVTDFGFTLSGATVSDVTVIPGWTTQWSVSVNGAAPSVSATPPVSVSTTDHVYITYQATSGDLSRVASIYRIPARAGALRSIPYLYDPYQNQ